MVILLVVGGCACFTDGGVAMTPYSNDNGEGNARSATGGGSGDSGDPGGVGATGEPGDPGSVGATSTPGDPPGAKGKGHKGKGRKPGHGYGDKNHDHSGPPGHA